MKILDIVNISTVKHLFFYLALLWVNTKKHAESKDHKNTEFNAENILLIMNGKEKNIFSIQFLLRTMMW